MAELPAITFGGRRLPSHAAVIDVAAACLGGVDEETAKWFWHFTICVGVRCSARSADVARHVALLREALRRRPDGFGSEVARRLPTADPACVVAEWEHALAIMERETGDSETCTWYAQPAEEP